MGAQVTRAGSHEVPAGTAAGQNHAETENQATREAADPVDRAAHMDGLAEIDSAQGGQHLRARQRDRRRQNPRPEPAAIAGRNDIRARGHGAEIRRQHDRAEDKPDGETAQGENGRRIFSKQG